MSDFFSEDWDPTKKPIKKVNVRAKGQNFERRCAKTLGSWYGKPFNRVPGSGGHKWGKSNAFKGDIVADGFPWAVECKNLSTGVPVIVVVKKSNEVRLAATTSDACKQSMADALHVNKMPMVLRNYGSKIHVIIPIPEKAEKFFSAILAKGPIFSGVNFTTTKWAVFEDISKNFPTYQELCDQLKNLYESSATSGRQA